MRSTSPPSSSATARSVTSAPPSNGLLAIHQVGRLLGSNPDQQAIGAALLESAQRIAPIDEAVLLLRSPRGHLTCLASSGPNSVIWPIVRRTRSARTARQQVLKTGSPQ